MLHGKPGWIVGIFLFLTCITASAGEKNAAPIVVDVQMAPKKVPKRARDRYIDGLKLYEHEMFKAAAKAFRDAYRISSDWKILYHIGKCEMALKRYGVATEVFEAYWENGGYSVSKAREMEILHIFDTLNRHTGAIAITGMAGVNVYVDGLQRGTLPLSKKIAVSSGVEHRLLIRQGEIVLLDKIIQVGTNDELAIAVPQGMSPKMLHTVRKPAREIDFTAIRAAKNSNRKLQTAALGTMGVGALGLVGSLIAGAYAKNKRDELIEVCDGSTTCVETPARTQKYNDAESAANAASALFATGATLAVVGTALLVVMKRNARKESSKNTNRESLKVQVQPAQGTTLIFSKSF